jgi:hypothetical protein
MIRPCVIVIVPEVFSQLALVCEIRAAMDRVYEGPREVARQLLDTVDALCSEEKLRAAFVSLEHLARVALGVVPNRQQRNSKPLSTYGKYRSAFGRPPSLYPVNCTMMTELCSFSGFGTSGCAEASL